MPVCSSNVYTQSCEHPLGTVKPPDTNLYKHNISCVVCGCGAYTQTGYEKNNRSNRTVPNDWTPMFTKLCETASHVDIYSLQFHFVHFSCDVLFMTMWWLKHGCLPWAYPLPAMEVAHLIQHLSEQFQGRIMRGIPSSLSTCMAT